MLVGFSTLLALIVAIPLGILQVVRRNKPIDYVVTGLSFIFYAMPAFLLGTLLIIYFAFDLNWFPVSAAVGRSPWDIFTDPEAFVLPYHPRGHHHRLVQPLHALLDDGRHDRGLHPHGPGQGGQPSRRVLYGHALRNALIPILTLLGLSLPAIVSGALITETVFNYPGMGLLTVDAAGNDDIPLVLGTTLVATVATVVGSLLADILYAVADPRIRFGSTRDDGRRGFDEDPVVRAPRPEADARPRRALRGADSPMRWPVPEGGEAALRRRPRRPDPPGLRREQAGRGRPGHHRLHGALLLRGAAPLPHQPDQRQQALLVTPTP